MVLTRIGYGPYHFGYSHKHSDPPQLLYWFFIKKFCIVILIYQKTGGDSGINNFANSQWRSGSCKWQLVCPPTAHLTGLYFPGQVFLTRVDGRFTQRLNITPPFLYLHANVLCQWGGQRSFCIMNSSVYL